MQNILQTPLKPKQGSEKVLVVDDSRETVRHLAESILPMMGYDSSWALNGEDALAKIRDEQPDVVMLDLNMPDMNGMDVLQALVDEVDCPPVVLMTGAGSEQAAIEAFRLGASDYLVKPFTTQEVVATIRKALDTSAAIVRQDTRPNPAQEANNQLNFQRLLAISTAITSLRDVDTIIDKVLRTALEDCHADYCVLHLEEPLIFPRGSWDLARNRGTVNPVADVSCSVRTNILKNGEVVCQSNLETGFDIGDGQMVRSTVAVPIHIDGIVNAVLCVGHLQTHHVFGENDKQLLTAIGEYAAIALGNAQVLTANSTA